MKLTSLFSRELIQDKVFSIAEQINHDYQDVNDLVIICVLKGSVFFFSDICKRLTVPYQIDFIRPASYGDKMTSSGFIKFSKNLEIDIKEKNVLVIEDIVDNGLTMHHILRKLNREKPLSIKTCVLVSKTIRREHVIDIDYVGFEIKSGFIVGYGLDYKENFRNLSEIYTVEKE